MAFACGFVDGLVVDASEGFGLAEGDHVWVPGVDGFAGHGVSFLCKNKLASFLFLFFCEWPLGWNPGGFSFADVLTVDRVGRACQVVGGPPALTDPLLVSSVARRGPAEVVQPGVVAFAFEEDVAGAALTVLGDVDVGAGPVGDAVLVGAGEEEDDVGVLLDVT